MMKPAIWKIPRLVTRMEKARYDSLLILSKKRIRNLFWKGGCIS